jgi:hypothetical protein
VDFIALIILHTTCRQRTLLRREMTKVPPHELATPEEWSQAHHRESILRPLVAKSSFSEPEIELAGEQMGVGSAYFYRLLSAYRQRPQTSTLLPRRDGLPTGTQLLSPGTESIVHKCIEDFYMSRVRPSFAALMRTISHECQRGHIQPPNFRTIKRRLATYDPKDLIASRFGSKAAREAFRPVQEHDLPALPFQLLQIDHSPVDLIVVDDRDRLPIGRPWLTRRVGFLLELYKMASPEFLAPMRAELRSTYDRLDPTIPKVGRIRRVGVCSLTLIPRNLRRFVTHDSTTQPLSVGDPATQRTRWSPYP